MNPIHARAIRKFLEFPFIMGLCLFLPAGTLDYWEGWVFAANFLICSIATTVYLARKDPALLERRLNAGPRSEKRPKQKIIMVVALISFVATMVVPALDRRFGWSHVPTELVVVGNLLVAMGFLAVLLVFRENTFAASNISLASEHHVISTGPYAWVRHPMYANAFWLMLGMPLALGSWWGLIALVPSYAGIILRLLDEERFLEQNLPGYSAYLKKVPYRLIPGIW